MLTEKIQVELTHQINLLRNMTDESVTTMDEIKTATWMLIAQKMEEINRRLSEIDTTLEQIEQKVREME